jgi:hypothetical protein
VSWSTSNSWIDQIELENRETCVARALRYEAETRAGHGSYDCVVVVRADVQVYGELSSSVLEQLAAARHHRAAFIPGSASGGDFGGIQNILGFYTRSAAETLIGFRDAVTHNRIPELPALEKHKWFAEPVLKLYLEREGVAITRFDLPLCRMAIAGGCRYPGEARIVVQHLCEQAQKPTYKTMKMTCRYLAKKKLLTMLSERECCSVKSQTDMLLNISATFREPDVKAILDAENDNFITLSPFSDKKIQLWINALKSFNPQCLETMQYLKGWPACFHAHDPYCCIIVEKCTALLSQKVNRDRSCNESTSTSRMSAFLRGEVDSLSERKIITIVDKKIVSPFSAPPAVGRKSKFGFKLHKLSPLINAVL